MTRTNARVAVTPDDGSFFMQSRGQLTLSPPSLPPDVRVANASAVHGKLTPATEAVSNSETDLRQLLILTADGNDCSFQKRRGVVMSAACNVAAVACRDTLVVCAVDGSVESAYDVTDDNACPVPSIIVEIYTHTRHHDVRGCTKYDEPLGGEGQGESAINCESHSILPDDGQDFLHSSFSRSDWLHLHV